MENNLKLNKEDLWITVMCLKKIHNQPTEDQELYSFIHGVIAILLDKCFSSYNAELIWQFAIDSKENKFNSFNELYDYISDPYSDIVHKYAGVDLETLIKLFPNEKMFKVFKEYIINSDIEHQENEAI